MTRHSLARESGMAVRGSHRMRQGVAAFLKDESGTTAIEYGLIAAGIALALITVLKGVGTNLKTAFASISTAVK